MQLEVESVWVEDGILEIILPINLNGANELIMNCSRLSLLIFILQGKYINKKMMKLLLGFERKMIKFTKKIDVHLYSHLTLDSWLMPHFVIYHPLLIELVLPFLSFLIPAATPFTAPQFFFSSFNTSCQLTII